MQNTYYELLENGKYIIAINRNVFEKIGLTEFYLINKIMRDMSIREEYDDNYKKWIMGSTICFNTLQILLYSILGLNFTENETKKK